MASPTEPTPSATSRPSPTSSTIDPTTTRITVSAKKRSSIVPNISAGLRPLLCLTTTNVSMKRSMAGERSTRSSTLAFPTKSCDVSASRTAVEPTRSTVQNRLTSRNAATSHSPARMVVSHMSRAMATSPTKRRPTRKRLEADLNVLSNEASAPKPSTPSAAFGLVGQEVRALHERPILRAMDLPNPEVGIVGAPKPKLST